MSSKQRREPWRSQERHHCKVCNAWMGGDKQSILMHEQGKKHQENAAQALADKRTARVEADKASEALQQALGQMNAAAVAAHLGSDVSQFGDAALQQLAAKRANVAATATNTNQRATAKSTPAAAVKPVDKKLQKEEKDAWKLRKKKRQDAKSKGNGDDDDDEDEEPDAKKAKRQLAPDEGHYTIDDKTYLEAASFGEILETDMPIELWLGPAAASHVEQRLLEKQHHWQPALVVRIRTVTPTIDVAYLKGDDEQVEQSVPMNCIRLVLGSDVSIPDTLAEARVAAMGEQVVVQAVPEQEMQVDDNTGFTSWGTVEVRQTTVRTELKEERERARQTRKEERERKEAEEKRAQGRRMEEARVENAEDSALGAYDVWNAGKEGYKGVEIHQNEKMTAADVGAGLAAGAAGKKVEFKKKGFKSKGKKRNARKTSADDM